METKELRLGNKIYTTRNALKTEGYIMTVMAGSYQSIEMFPEAFKPIPLTDEWKTKLSFKQYPYEPENLNEGYYWSLQVIKGIYLTIEDGDDYAYLDYGLDFNGTKNLIKYQFVHEIQNVYNILKKEDITIK